MKPDPSTDADLKTRFATLRDAETHEAPSFARTLAVVREREARPQERSSFLWIAGTAAAVAAIGLFLASRISEKADPTSLAEAIPVLLPSSSDAGTLFPSPLFAENRLPSDSILPFHLDFPL